MNANVVWPLADRMQVAPMQPDAVLRARLAAWTAHPLTPGCSHAYTSEPSVVCWPDPAIRCARCALEVFADESRCIYCCDSSVEMGRDTDVIHEVGAVVFLSRAHQACADGA